MSTGPLRPDAVSAFVRLARAVPADPTDKPKHHSFFLVTGLILRLAGRISQDAGLPPADRGEVLRDPAMAAVPVQVFLADGYRPYVPPGPGPRGLRRRDRSGARPLPEDGRTVARRRSLRRRREAPAFHGR